VRRFLFSCLLVAVSAALYGLSFPPTGWTALSWVAVAPLLVALRRGGIGQALFLSWLWCVVGACVAGDWFPRSVADYFQQPMAVALALFVGVFTIMAGPYFMLFAAVYRALARRYELLLPLLTGAAWVGAELARGRLLTGSPIFIGNPWGLTGYAQSDVLPLVQIASITGIYGVGFAVVCVNAAVAELWMGRRLPGRARSRLAAAFGLALLPALASLAYGYRALGNSEAAAIGQAPVAVAVAQGNLSVGRRWRSDMYGQNLEVYLGLSHEAASQHRPRVIFWPESAMAFFLDDEPLYRKAIARVLRHHDTELLAGGPGKGASADEYTNSIYSISPEGEIQGRYDKEYLVPFAEYFPFEVDLLDRDFSRVRNFVHGTQIAPIPTRAGPAGIVVCNEVMLPEVVGQRVADGAVYLVNPSNDSWIDDPKYTGQQFDIARMRAIEQRRYLVRASTAGPSAIIDPWGRVIAATEVGTRGFASGFVRAISERTFYGRMGDVFAILCVIVVAAALVLRRAR